MLHAPAQLRAQVPLQVVAPANFVVTGFHGLIRFKKTPVVWPPVPPVCPPCQDHSGELFASLHGLSPERLSNDLKAPPVRNSDLCGGG